jgi:quinol monooxygenase YgiN
MPRDGSARFAASFRAGDIGPTCRARREPAAPHGRNALIHLLAIITAMPGQRDTVLALFHANIPAVRAEAGCIEYTPAIDAAGFEAIQAPLGPDSFMVIEKWASAEALKAHGAAPHMAEYAAKSREFVASRVLHVLTAA